MCEFQDVFGCDYLTEQPCCWMEISLQFIFIFLDTRSWLVDFFVWKPLIWSIKAASKPVVILLPLPSKSKPKDFDYFFTTLQAKVSSKFFEAYGYLKFLYHESLYLSQDHLSNTCFSLGPFFFPLPKFLSHRYFADAYMPMTPWSTFLSFPKDSFLHTSHKSPKDISSSYPNITSYFPLTR